MESNNKASCYGYQNNNQTVENSTLLYSTSIKKIEYRKNIIFSILFLFFGLILAWPYISSILSGQWHFSSLNEFRNTLFAFGFFFPAAIFLFKSLMFNKIIISNEYIFIRKGVSGITVIIANKDLHGFHHERHYSRGHKSDNINFWCKNGSHIRSGVLYLDESSLEELKYVLSHSLNLPELTPWDMLKSGREIRRGKSGQETNLDYISLIFTIIPFILCLLLICIYCF